MIKILNINEIPRDLIDDADFTGPMITQYLSKAAGSEKLYVNIDILKPGAKSARYHSHT
ncbi:MAG: mannose-6-phosphate isomerase, partial [Deltaproteobacteria bacterium]|nr:mannose-6-phosphate isomerase [Deltaproteobacteria bacterium]